jgi:predicted acyltransferase
MTAASGSPRRGGLPLGERDGALDAFRGLTVLLMILVNLPGSWDHAYPLLLHAPWNGLTLADLVFPWFLLIVGASAALAPPAAWRAILRRTVLLFALGVVLGWLIRPTLEPDQLRWTGVLQRIAIVYLVCAAVVALSHSGRAPLALAAALMALHAALLLLVPVPGGAAPSLAPGQGWAGWLDQALLPGRLHHGRWDPEGVLSTLGAMASGLIGVALARARRDGLGWPRPMVALLAMGGLALLVLPLNKALWTPSYVLVTAGLGVAVWALLGVRRWPWLTVLGQTALTAYAVHMLLIALLVRRLPSGETLWASLFAPLAGSGLPLPLAALLFALLATLLCTAPMAWLARRGWVLKV